MHEFIFSQEPLGDKYTLSPPEIGGIFQCLEIQIPLYEDMAVELFRTDVVFTTIHWLIVHRMDAEQCELSFGLNTVSQYDQPNILALLENNECAHIHISTDQAIAINKYLTGIAGVEPMKNLVYLALRPKDPSFYVIDLDEERIALYGVD